MVLTGNQQCMAGGLTKLILLTRAIASDCTVRRKLMSGIIIAALVMVFVGAFLIWDVFVEHPIVFALYWLACGWLVITASLLAIYDLLQVVRTARSEQRAAKSRAFKDLN